MGVDACGRPTELPDDYNVGADGAPGETHDFLSLLSHIPGGVWDAAKSTAQGVAGAASGAWNVATDSDGARQRLRDTVDHAATAVHDGAVQAWNHPGDTLSAAAHQAAASVDRLGTTCSSNAGHAVGGLMLDYATGKVVASTVGKAAGLARDAAPGGATTEAAALETPQSVAPEAPLPEPAKPAAVAPPEPPVLRATPRDGVIGGKPTGIAETPNPGANEAIKTALQLQNASGDAMARAGYRVEWQPQVAPEDNIKIGKRPDMRLGDDIADVVAPRSPDVEQIRKAIKRKPEDGQAFRVILNLGRTDVTREQIEDLLKRKPVTGLQELFAIEKNGAISRILPDPAQVIPPPGVP